MIPKDEKTLEIARRTRSNLEFMDRQQKNGEKVYEFTQLFNSMLGMIVCVREEYYKGRGGKQAVEWSDIHQYKKLTVSPSVEKKATSFSTLISNLRHAFAHSNYDFTSDESKVIIGVKVWNIKDSVKKWEETLTEDELREVANLAVEYLELKFGMGWHGNPEY